MRLKKHICVKQHDYKDCGVACIATLLKTYGLDKPISQIREMSGTDLKGTSALGLVKTLESLGFSAKGVKVSKPEDIFQEYPKPCIAHVIVEQKMLHYVVIHEVTKDKVIIADPAKGIVKMQINDFLNIWTGILILATPTNEFKKGKETQNIYGRFFTLLKPQKKLLANIFLSSILYTVSGILASFYFKIILDEILPNNLEKTLLIISIGIILLYIFKALLDAFRSYLLYILAQKLDIPLILGFYYHVLDLPMNFFGTRKIGEIITRFMDASKIRDAISSTALSMMIDTFMAIAGGAILYMQDSTLFFIALAILIIYGIIVISFNKPLRVIQEKSMEENAQLTSYIVESLTGIQTVKSYNAENQTKEITEIKFIKFLKTNFKNGILINWQTFLTAAVATVGTTIIIWVGAYKVLNGEISIGSLLTFNALLAYFFDPIKNLINLQPKLQTAIVASDRLGEVFDLQIEKEIHQNSTVVVADLKGNINIKNLDFRYGSRQLVLKNINMSIKSGERIAFVGESGSGKTTLSKLLLNFYTFEKGEISINNININDIDLKSLRNKIAYISQDTFLFSGTIVENMKVANENASLEDIIDVCKLSRAHEFINSLPLRYNTYIEENGSNLSGGQKQRLAIARALLSKPDIIIMDEATSSLDTITEKAIENTINNLSDNVTMIMIAHRLSTIVNCDCIYVFEDGGIIEYGNHKQLLDKKGKYFQLWNEQVRGIEYDKL